MSLDHTFVLGFIINNVVMGFGFHIGKSKWVLGTPDPEDIFPHLENMSKEISLETMGKELQKDNSFTIKLLLNDKCLDRLVMLGKFTHFEIEKLRVIRNSLEDKHTFFEVFYPVYVRERGWDYDKQGTVSIYWYYERMLLEQGLRKHGNYVKKRIKVMKQDYERSQKYFTQERSEQISKQVDSAPTEHEMLLKMKEVDKILENSDVMIPMDEIVKLALQHPTDQMFQDVTSPEEYHYRYRALHNSMMGEYEKCIELCNEGLKINPESPYLYYMRGRTKADCGKWQEGADDLGMAIKLKDHFADAYVELGYIHLKTGDREKAEQCFEVAREIEPDIKLPEYE